MVRVVVTISMALALLAGAGHARPPSAPADPQSIELARAVVAADGDRARLSRLNTLGFMIADQIEQTLQVTDLAEKEKIAGIVHRRLHAWEDDLIEARVSAMARTFTVNELQGNLAFGGSPTGQVLRTATPKLNESLASLAFGQGVLAANAPPLSKQKVDLINRILSAREVEANARKGWRLTVSMMAKLSSAASKTTPPSDIAAETEAEDAYVKRVVLVETQFYSNNFSEAQLSDLAAYFDGPTGRAFARRAPELTSNLAGEVPKIFDRLFDGMDKEACHAVECTPSQQAALGARLAVARSMTARGIDATLH